MSTSDKDSRKDSPKDSVVPRVSALVEPILANEALELVDVEYAREGGRWILRLVIDKVDAGPGNYVGVDDCQRASQAVETALDVADLIPHEYALEVSSPGIERPLTRPEHFLKFIGKKVKVRTFGPLFTPPRKNFSGTLLGYADGMVEIEVEGAGRFQIPQKEIAKAHLEAEWE